MTLSNDFATRFMAAVAAVLTTTTILVSSFSTPEASIIAGLVA